MDLKRIRKVSKLSQVDLAFRAGVSQTVVSILEKYPDFPGFQNAKEKISKALGINKNDLFPIQKS